MQRMLFVGLLAGLLFAQNPGIQRTVVFKGDVSVPGREAVIARVEIAPGTAAGRHTHPGDEYTTVLEGEIVGRIDGNEAKTYATGQSYHNEPGVVHEGSNKGSAPAKTFNVFVVEKGKPVTEPAKR